MYVLITSEDTELRNTPSQRSRSLLPRARSEPFQGPLHHSKDTDTFCPSVRPLRPELVFLLRQPLLWSGCGCRLQTPETVKTHFKENLQKFKSVIVTQQNTCMWYPPKLLTYSSQSFQVFWVLGIPLSKGETLWRLLEEADDLKDQATTSSWGPVSPLPSPGKGKAHKTPQSLHKAQRAAPRDSHCHAVQELLYCLAINGDSHTGIGIKGEFQTVEHTGLLTILCRAVCIVFVPTKSGQKMAGQEP